MKVTKLVDTETQAILDLHCTTTWEGSDAEICEQLARKHAGELRVLTADKGYDCNWLREDLRELDIRPLIKHCVHAPYDHAHNARSMTSSTANEQCQKPSSLLSSARWASPCEREPGTENFVRSR